VLHLSPPCLLSEKKKKFVARAKIYQSSLAIVLPPTFHGRLTWILILFPFPSFSSFLPFFPFHCMHRWLDIWFLFLFPFISSFFFLPHDQQQRSEHDAKLHFCYTAISLLSYLSYRSQGFHICALVYKFHMRSAACITPFYHCWPPVQHGA